MRRKAKCPRAERTGVSLERSDCMALAKEKIYTIDDIFALPDGQRAELIDGRWYDMAPPNRLHQKLSSELHTKINNYIKKHNETCDVYAAPFAVFLNKDDRNYVEPDLSVICDKSKLDDRGCSGAPDWIIEIVSPSSPRMDYDIKLFKYHTAGVREYWIVNPMKQTVTVYDFEHGNGTNQYSFDEVIPGCVFAELEICIADLM